MHRALKVEAQPFLDPAHSTALGQIQEQHQIQHDRRGQDTVATQEVDLDLHGITEPSIDVDVVPSFLVVSPRGIVMDAHLMREIFIQVWIKLWLKDLIQYRELALLLRLE